MLICECGNALCSGEKNMSEVLTGGRGTGALDDKLNNSIAIGAAEFLYLGAAPTFAIMALLTAVLGGGSLDVLCSGASPLSGMVPMYALMSAFHMAPWLKLISRRGSATGES
jgi:hypothetical protein